MRYRLFGRTGLRVSELFLGAMTFGGGGASPEECRRMVDRYVEAGGNVIDTANAYQGGESERVLGELLRDQRDQFVLASKYTISRDGADPNAAGNHKKNLRLSLEASLRRLNTDYLDIYWVHVWDRHTPIEETMQALDDAVRSGKVLYIGISDAPSWVVARANTLAEWRNWAAFAGLQVPYNLLNRDIERELLPMAEAFGMSVAVWGPLAGGVLSGKFTADKSVEGNTRRSADSLSEHERTLSRTVAALADQLGVTPAQVAIAWTRSASHSVHPIIGARNVAQLEDNLGALDVTLSTEQLQALNSAAEFTLGFPRDFIEGLPPSIFGESAARVDGR